MSELDLEAIKVRSERLKKQIDECVFHNVTFDEIELDLAISSARDIPALVAEVDRLRGAATGGSEHISPEQYHCGVDKLWDALGLTGVQEEDVFTLASRKIKSSPSWMDRPSCPGAWVCIAGDKFACIDRFSQSDLDQGSPLYASRVYGPIPIPEDVQ